MGTDSIDMSSNVIKSISRTLLSRKLQRHGGRFDDWEIVEEKPQNWLDDPELWMEVRQRPYRSKNKSCTQQFV